MTNEPSPRPWRVEENVVGWTSFIVDANGDGVAACWRTARGDDEKERQYNEANARLICDAVNTYAIKSPCRVCSGYAQKGGCIADERDRLRDALKRIIDATYDIDKGCPDFRAIARAAIGEDAP